MDSNRFDNLARRIGEETDRRRMLQTAAGGAMALAGLGAVSRVALGQDVDAESQGFKGDPCDNDNDCRKGLICKSNGRCKYKKNCGGRKGDACQKNKHCCKNKNLICKRRKCKRDKK